MDTNIVAGLILLLAAILAAVLLARRRTRHLAEPAADASLNSIRRVALGLIAGFVAVSIGLVYWQVLRAAELVDRPDNIRRIRLRRRNRRGSILDRQGRPLAVSEEAPNGFMRRVYLSQQASPVTGYSSLRYGQTGIEAAFDEFLTGEYAASPLDPLRRRLLHEQPVGADVTLTIDLDLQNVAVEALAGQRGAVVVMHVKTGAILALASVPFIDPNQLVLDPVGDPEIEAELVQRYWTALNENPGRPLLNRATQGLYSPGSIFKTVTLATALDQGVANLDTLYRYDLNSPDAEHSSVWHRNEWTDCQNHEASTFDLALGYAYSCNVLFSELGVDVGADAFITHARRFGLGSPIPIEIVAEVSQVAVSEDYFTGPEATYALASTAFGQGQLLVTPLQAVLLAVAPANRGVIPKPHLVQQITGPEGNVVRRAQAEQWRAALQPDVAAKTFQAMVVSVEEGWARVIALPGVQVAGKTGTAEVVNDETKDPHAWFIACAPADDPTYAVAVVREFAGGGATFAGPIAQTVLAAALRLG